MAKTPNLDKAILDEQEKQCEHLIEIIGNIHDNPDLLEVARS